MHYPKLVKSCIFSMLVGTFVCARASTTYADDADKTKAQALFMEGRAAIEKGDNATGCSKMRESLKIFAVANTLFNVAQCDEGDGKIAAALEHWERGLALIEPKDPRSKVAKERIAALSLRVPRLRIVIPSGQAISTILLDDNPMSPTALEAPLYVEPGSHVIVVQAPGRKDRRHQLTLAERERTEFVATPASEAIPSPEQTPVENPTKKPPGPVPTQSNARRTVGFVVGGIGVAGLVAAGITTGLVVISDSEIQTCVNTQDWAAPCRRNIRQSVDDYKSLLTANVVAWSVGAAGITTGLLLILTAPAKKEHTTAIIVAPIVVSGGAGIGLSGRF